MMSLNLSLLLCVSLLIILNVLSSEVHTCSSSSGASTSLYHEYCCIQANIGQSFKLRRDGITSFIFCPQNETPKSCLYQSCKEILDSFPNSKSGYYNITASNGTMLTVYCDMEGSSCDGQGGWMRIGHINMTETNATCPEGLRERDFASVSTLLCGGSSLSFGCNSTFFLSYGLHYTKVCGQVRGYQYGSTDGIYPVYGPGSSSNIDGVYVDGISITYGSNPRQHIWTYVAGNVENSLSSANCPCNNGSSQTTPSFVGEDYYCEAGTLDSAHRALYPDPLWDGQQCGHFEATCCISPKMPWFVKTLPRSITNDVEFRMCNSAGSLHEDAPVDIVEIYIR